ncbi:MAG TPA: tetratricopeptide repeat protein [Verrucomicrobiae bacterium]|nr:tetratricopeptide repeat protein [Verrucomicrobiae bacterium]
MRPATSQIFALFLAAALSGPALAQAKTLQEMQHEASGFEAQQDWANAEKIYAEMPKAFPEQAEAYFWAGRFFTDRRRLKEAADYFERGLQKNPESETAHLYLARIYIALGDMVKSDAHSKAALKIQAKIRSQYKVAVEKSPEPLPLPERKKNETT